MGKALVREESRRAPDKVRRRVDSLLPLGDREIVVACRVRFRTGLYSRVDDLVRALGLLVCRINLGDLFFVLGLLL